MNNFFDKRFLTRFFLTIFLLLFLFQSVFGLTTIIIVELNSVKVRNVAATWGTPELECSISTHQIAVELYTNSDSNGFVNNNNLIKTALFGGPGGVFGKCVNPDDIDANNPVTVPCIGALRKGSTAFLSFERKGGVSYFLRLSMAPRSMSNPCYNNSYANLPGSGSPPKRDVDVAIDDSCRPNLNAGIEVDYVEVYCKYHDKYYAGGYAGGGWRWQTSGCELNPKNIRLKNLQVVRNCSVPLGVYSITNVHRLIDGTHYMNIADPLYPQRFCINFGRII